MKTVDHSYEQALIMHDNVHIHVIMNIIVTPKMDVAHSYYILLQKTDFGRFPTVIPIETEKSWRGAFKRA